jgi:hypothetical protein
MLNLSAPATNLPSLRDGVPRTCLPTWCTILSFFIFFDRSKIATMHTIWRRVLQHSDGEKSDQDLVVDDASEDPVSPPNGTTSPRENGIDKLVPKKEHPGPHSPRSGTSSNASTPSTKKLDGDKPSTPISKSVTPTSAAGSSSGGSGLKPVVKPPALGQYPPYLAGMSNGKQKRDIARWKGSIRSFVVSLQERLTTCKRPRRQAPTVACTTISHLPSIIIRDRLCKSATIRTRR